MSVGAIRAGRAMVEIFADSSMLARGLASAQSKMARFAQTIRRLGTTQVVLGVGMAAPIAAAVRQYAMLEQRINTVRALTGATVGQMRGLTQAIRQIGMETGRPFTEIADGMGELSRAGVRLQSLGRATRVVADFSRAAGVDMARAANIGVEVLTEFGLSMDHLPRVADVLQEMANATVSTVEDLSDGFRYAGQTARLFGLSLEQAGSAIAYLQQSGLPSTTAGTSLNQMLLQMVENLDKLEAAVGGLRGANGEFLPFADILGKVQQHIADMPGPERIGWLNKMFDVRGMRGADGLLKNIEAWMALTAQAEGSMGSSKRKATEMSRAFVVSFEKMQNGLVDFSYAVGEVLDSDLRSAFGTLANLASSLGPFIKANGEAVRSVAKFAAVLTVSGATFFTVGVSLQLLAFSFEGFVKASLAAYAPINGLVGLGKMLGVAFASTASQVTRAGAAITATVSGFYAAVSRPIDAAIASVTAFGASFVSMHRTVSGAVSRTVASVNSLRFSAFRGSGSTARGAAAAATQAVGAAAAGAAAATAGAGRAAAAPVAAAAGTVLPQRRERVRRLPRGPARMAPSGPRMVWYRPEGADLIYGSRQLTRRRRQREANRAYLESPEGFLRNRPQGPTDRQRRIAELVAANRARRQQESSMMLPEVVRTFADRRAASRGAADFRDRDRSTSLWPSSYLQPRLGPPRRPFDVRRMNPLRRAMMRASQLRRGLQTGYGLSVLADAANPLHWGGAISSAIGRSRMPALARGMMTGYGRQTLGVTSAMRGAASAAAMALPVVKLTAALAAAAAAAAVLRKAVSSIGPLVAGIGGGLAKVFDGFSSRAKAVWPEIQQTVKTGWRGVMDAINAGDLSLAWKVFADTAKATFAQIMVIIGPFVDDTVAIFSDIGTTLSSVFWNLVQVAGDAFSAISEVVTPVLSLFADIGESMLEGIAWAFPNIADMFSSLGGYAESAGERIFEALAAGDIVKAWMAATTAIQHMFIDLGSAWDRYVAKPFKMFAVKVASDDIRRNLGQPFDTGRGIDNFARGRLNAILDSSTPEQLAANRRNAEPELARLRADVERGNRPGASATTRGWGQVAAAQLEAFEEAISAVNAQFKQLGIVTEEAAQAEIAAKHAALEQQHQRKLDALNAGRARAAKTRADAADRSAAKVQAGASAAAELRARKDMERRIGEATTQEELDKIQRELDGKTAKTDGDEGAARVLRGQKTEQEFAALKSKIEGNRKGRVAEIQKEGEAFGLSQNEIDANIAAQERHAARISASSSMVDIDRSGADYLDELAGIMERFRGSGAKDEQGQTGDELRKRAQGLRDEADRMIRDAQQRFQDPANKTRAEEAENLRVQAAEQRRAGDEGAAAKLEESAAALEQAVDAMEAAEMQKQINEARQAIANEQALRGQQAAAGGEAAAAVAKRLDSVGGFMSSAFERMGYGSNLGERQAKAAEEAARGINKLVGIVERNGGVFA